MPLLQFKQLMDGGLHVIPSVESQNEIRNQESRQMETKLGKWKNKHTVAAITVLS